MKQSHIEVKTQQGKLLVMCAKTAMSDYMLMKISEYLKNLPEEKIEQISTKIMPIVKNEFKNKQATPKMEQEILNKIMAI